MEAAWMVPDLARDPISGDVLGPLPEDYRNHLRVQAFLARVTYKPGWRFTAEPPATVWERGQLRMEFDATDARHPTSGLRVTVTAVVPYPRPDDPDEVLVDWLWMAVLGAEQHEAGEWFHVNGERPHDPHRSTKEDVW